MLPSNWCAFQCPAWRRWSFFSCFITSNSNHRRNSRYLAIAFKFVTNSWLKQHSFHWECLAACWLMCFIVLYKDSRHTVTNLSKCYSSWAINIYEMCISIKYFTRKISQVTRQTFMSVLEIKLPSRNLLNFVSYIWYFFCSCFLNLAFFSNKNFLEALTHYSCPLSFTLFIQFTFFRKALEHTISLVLQLNSHVYAFDTCV